MKAETFFGVFAAALGLSLYQHPHGSEISISGLLILAALGVLIYWLQKPSAASRIGAVGNATNGQSPGERVLFRLGKLLNRLTK
jgi:uncharacterized membrane protein YjjB (DUF3815 family)